MLLFKFLLTLLLIKATKLIETVDIVIYFYLTLLFIFILLTLLFIFI